ncbi:MAG: NAD(+)/NADH kinase [Candidatus Marinimicrobia bacterium]|nr:NAD(+)/NADH kinase [Candidatus Neomarinimicrobiota bacterium]
MKIGLHLHPRFETQSKSLPLIVEFLISKGQAVVLPESFKQNSDIPAKSVEYLPSEKMPEVIDAMFSVGGDGTFLGASRLMAQTGKPVLGIHLGGLGFLADVSMENYKERLTAFFDGDFKIEQRSVLNARVIFPDRTDTYFAFNDFVVDKGSVLTMIKIRTYVDDDYFNTYRSDGLIISTPTGSTAYSLSAGGPIISPNLNVIVISPICPHSLSARPVIIADNQTIRLECAELNNDVSLMVDGQKRVSLLNAVKVEIHKANFTLKIIRFRGDSFFQTLRTKMNWGLDARGN